MANISKININGVEYNIKDAALSGTLAGPLVVTGGDGANAGKIALSKSGLGQITDESTSTLFGFLNTTELTVGGSGLKLRLRGSETRPKYNGNDLARYSDLPTVPSNIVTGSGQSYTIAVVSALPASPDANTIYIVI